MSMRGSTLVVLVVIALFKNGFTERQEECLAPGDPECNYVMGYDPDMQNKEITFDVTVKTRGYVGFGLAPKAGMDNADIVIGGFKDGGKYFKDYHGTGKWLPTLDESQDWTLLDAKENDTHTYLKFKRLFDTCDTEGDIIISANTINLIWSFGKTDDIKQHSETDRGGRQFLLLDPPSPITDIEQFEIHEIRVTNPVPPVRTSYLCSFHKFPKFDSQKYLVGVEAYLNSTEAVLYTHHFTVTTCRMDNIAHLEKLLAETKIKAKDCFEELLYMRNYCNEVLFGWAVGGKRVMLPEHVGIPFGEASSESDPEGSLYIMLEVHYENPKAIAGINYTTGFDTFYTDKKREHEGSIIMVGHEVNPALLLPPQAKHHVVAGHCSSEITQALVPPEGVNIIAVNMHSHIAGRQIRVRQYRDGMELPWILNDVNYDFDYQQTRELRKEIKLMPGDHLVNECVFDTMDRDVVTLGGEGTHDEMCHSFLIYYPRIALRGCKSHYPLPELFDQFGITQVNLTEGNLFDPTIVAPEKMEGKLFSEVLNGLEWTDKLRNNVQEFLRYGHHKAIFTAGNYEGEVNKTFLAYNFGVPKNYGIKNTKISEYTGYPAISDYKLPESDCKARGLKLVNNLEIILAAIFIIFNFL